LKNSIDTKELLEILRITPPEQNIMLSGKHGIGKSQILTSYYEKKKMKVVTLFLGQLSDPGDILGLPKLNEETGRTDFIPPYWFPTDNQPIVLFLDELNRAREEILQCVMDLALNRKLAGRYLPEGSVIISAVNSGDEYQLTDLDPALISRFNIYTFEPSVENWIEWAEKNQIDGRVIDYIKKNPARLDECLSESEKDNLEKSTDRRGWVKVSDILKNVDKLKQFHIKALSGVIGLSAATDFVAQESKRESQKITGSEILTQGESLFKSIEHYSIPDFSSIIDSIFEFLSMADGFDEKKSKEYVENLNAFVEFVYESKKYEVLGYLVSVYTQTENYGAKEFIQQKCEKTMELIKKFVSEYSL